MRKLFCKGFFRNSVLDDASVCVCVCVCLLSSDVLIEEAPIPCSVSHTSSNSSPLLPEKKYSLPSPANIWITSVSPSRDTKTRHPPTTTRLRGREGKKRARRITSVSSRWLTVDCERETIGRELLRLVKCRSEAIVECCRPIRRVSAPSKCWRCGWGRGSSCQRVTTAFYSRTLHINSPTQRNVVDLLREGGERKGAPLCAWDLPPRRALILNSSSSSNNGGGGGGRSNNSNSSSSSNNNSNHNNNPLFRISENSVLQKKKKLCGQCPQSATRRVDYQRRSRAMMCLPWATPDQPSEGDVAQVEAFCSDRFRRRFRCRYWNPLRRRGHSRLGSKLICGFCFAVLTAMPLVGWDRIILIKRWLMYRIATVLCIYHRTIKELNYS